MTFLILDSIPLLKRVTLLKIQPSFLRTSATATLYYYTMATENKKRMSKQKTLSLSDVTAEVESATSAFIADEEYQDNDNGLHSSMSYCLGERQDRELFVTDNSEIILSKS